MEKKNIASSNYELLKEINSTLENMNKRINSLQQEVKTIKKVVTEKDISYIEFEEPEKNDKLEILDNNRGWFF
tara:strand:- start:70 stop:288 length:219 start_codon:yes stop_codon:yes gene_type:complete